MLFLLLCGSSWCSNHGIGIDTANMVLELNMLVDCIQTEEYYDPGEYVSLVYADRMRTATDKQKVFTAFEETFESWPSEHCVDIRITTDHVQIGHSWLKRRATMANLDARGRDGSLQLLHHCVAPLESLIKCIQMNWMAILVRSF